jgi:WD40 repeat protein
LKGDGGMVFGVAFRPDGKRLASCSSNPTVRLWDVASGEETLALVGHTSYVYSVAFSPDGNKLVSSSFDGTVSVWNVVEK